MTGIGTVQFLCRINVVIVNVRHVDKEKQNERLLRTSQAATEESTGVSGQPQDQHHEAQLQTHKRSTDGRSCNDGKVSAANRRDAVDQGSEEDEMIEDMRVVEWTEGVVVKRPRWNIEIKRKGSDKWEPIEIVNLDKKTKKRKK